MSTKANKIAALLVVAVGGWLLYRRATAGSAPLETINFNDVWQGLQAELSGKFFADLGGGGINLDTWKTPAAGAAYEPTFMMATSQYNLPPGLISRMAYQESKFRPEIINGTVRSPAGATGIMQLMPVHWSQVDPLNPAASIMYAAQYMAQLFRQFGAWDKALAAYNWGPGNLKKRIAEKGEDWLIGMNTETYNYVAQIGRDIGLLYYGTKQQGVA